MKKKDKNTEQVILQTARKIFIQKGLTGARMQDIADQAGFNKALVHYYFTSKDNLFNLVFEQEFSNLFSSLATIVASDLPLFEKIESIVSLDIERLSQFPGLPNFVLNEMSRNPDVLLKRLKRIPVEKVLIVFQKQINSEIKKGTIRKITAEQLFINIQSMCIFPFIARPMIKALMQMDEKTYMTMIQRRKTEVAQFIISAIKA
ncbi:MAG: TetR/AcrR family transcriptional regulator [Ferruginibacter sp.]|nr:TetR/AcrR family transcriptional regulator [Chitinophagaceae bacterium]MBP6287027.1 TetR/AcrR family transcriptional regulator [Ferruginibacter sp.]MBU9936361.1 TetR/AcrR family transcriptional regulator [Ferruginibacter sp.]HQY11029.1 TetR/AcrR family transcriptional regulator [Ferruginibacter sp.]